MGKVSVWAIVLLVVAGIAFGIWLLARPATPGGAIPAGARQATVASVHDGDTLFLDLDGREQKVRLIGVDTPELAGSQGADTNECWAAEARQELRDLLPEGTSVWVLADQEPTDRYDRLLLYVFTDDGTLINRALVLAGAGEAIRIGANDRYWDALQEAQLDARTAGAGLWSSCAVG